MTSQDGVSDGSGDERSTNQGPTVLSLLYRHMDEDAEPENPLSCPWCCAPPRKFRTRHYPEPDGRKVVGCSSCSAVIPYEAEWYLRGRKICLENTPLEGAAL